MYTHTHTQPYSYIQPYMFRPPAFWGIYQPIEFLDHVIILCLTFWYSAFIFIFLASLHGLWDLSSLTRDWTWALSRVLTTGPPGNSLGMVLIHTEFNETISYADRRLNLLIFRLYWGCPLLWKIISPTVALELLEYCLGSVSSCCVRAVLCPVCQGERSPHPIHWNVL